MSTLPQMGLRDSPHHCLDVLGFAHPQTQVDCQRLSTQTVQRHRLTNRLHDRPQILNAHIYTQVDFNQLKTEKCILKPPNVTTTKTVQQVGVFELWRHWAASHFVKGLRTNIALFLH